MNIANYILLGFGTLSVLAVAALLLPRSTKVARERMINKDAGVLYELVASNKAYQSINPYRSSDPNLQIELFGPEQGVGSGFRFDGKDGKGSQTVSAIDENRSVTLDIDLGSMGKPTQRVTFEPSGQATHVRWEMEMDLGMNPIARVFGLFMDKFVGPIFERALTNMSTTKVAAR